MALLAQPLSLCPFCIVKHDHYATTLVINAVWGSRLADRAPVRPACSIPFAGAAPAIQRAARREERAAPGRSKEKRGQRSLARSTSISRAFPSDSYRISVSDLAPFSSSTLKTKRFWQTNIFSA